MSAILATADSSAEVRAAAVAAAQLKACVAERNYELVSAIKHYEQGLALAVRLYDTDSLVVACSNLVLVTQRYNLAGSAACSPVDAHRQRALCAANLLAGLTVLEVRRAAGTLTTTRPDETVFEAARRENLRRIQGMFAPPPEFHTMMSAYWLPHFGYICSLWAAIGCCALLFSQGSAGLVGPAATARLEKALLDAIDMISVMRNGPSQPPGLSNQEISLADTIRDALTKTGVQATAFGTRLAASWERPSVLDRLQALGLPAMSVAMAQRYSSEAQRAKARTAARADARSGLRCCALASCGARELRVAHFKLCSRCRSVAYCSAEHGAEDWRAGHKRQCKALAEAAAN